MRHRYLFALATALLAAGIASPQSISPDLQQYLTLTDAQVQSINKLNSDFSQYTNRQQTQYYHLLSQASGELAKDSPDAGTVGSLYAQIEMLNRDYYTQLAQLQSNVAALLTTAQVMQVSGLLAIARLQPLAAEAQCVALEPPSTLPTGVERQGNFNSLITALAGNSFAYSGYCYSPPVPTALANYLNLSDTQVAAIETADQGNQDYLNRQSVKIEELQFEIQDLTAAPVIDAAKLGADYVAIAQLHRNESTQAGQLTTTVRNLLTDQQQPLLKALDNALALFNVEFEAASNNILVLPPDLTQTCTSFSPYAGCGYYNVVLGYPSQ